MLKKVKTVMKSRKGVIFNWSLVGKDFDLYLERNTNVQDKKTRNFGQVTSSPAVVVLFFFIRSCSRARRTGSRSIFIFFEEFLKHTRRGCLHQKVRPRNLQGNRFMYIISIFMFVSAGVPNER